MTEKPDKNFVYRVEDGYIYFYAKNEVEFINLVMKYNRGEDQPYMNCYIGESWYAMRLTGRYSDDFGSKSEKVVVADDNFLNPYTVIPEITWKRAIK